MYVVLLNYTAAIEEIDDVVPDHVEWLNKQYEDGHFVASGPKNPRVGGVIITRRMAREKLDAILAGDPFAVKHVAQYEVIEFSATKTAPELSSLQEAATG